MGGFNEYVFLSIGSIAMFSFVAVAVWSNARRQEREAYYKSETIRKIAEMPGAGGSAALDFLREEAKTAVRRRREGIKVAGLVTPAVGIGLMTFLRFIEPDEPVYLVGLIPVLVGVALLTYSFVLAPKE